MDKYDIGLTQGKRVGSDNPTLSFLRVFLPCLIWGMHVSDMALYSLVANRLPTNWTDFFSSLYANMLVQSCFRRESLRT
ncbi:hypothetical protein M408DRAFT_328333 [Serendipita vermifera MAFF 305830]|uniref:Uncharacterized protein n=1 Tax=Serendipita vermifera MAFF 305830 TaxID=933852 RepID=A0A0C2XMX3_SERVB|nr:hypothetical protein M408DRAFT_328333 [Serendipita vermifera MAFF 305830]